MKHLVKAFLFRKEFFLKLPLERIRSEVLRGSIILHGILGRYIWLG